jgi:hypothetical protein
MHRHSLLAALSVVALCGPGGVGVSYVMAEAMFAEGCRPLPANSPLPADVQAEADCVAHKILAGESDAAALLSCVGGDIIILGDILDWLFSKATFTAKLRAGQVLSLRSSLTRELLRARATAPSDAGK